MFLIVEVSAKEYGMYWILSLQYMSSSCSSYEHNHSTIKKACELFHQSPESRKKQGDTPVSLWGGTVYTLLPLFLG